MWCVARFGHQIAQRTANDPIKRLKRIKHISSVNQKNKIFKTYIKDGRPNSVYKKLQTITWDLTEAIISSKNVCYERLANKLKDPNISSKTYWSIIKTLVSGKKVAVIPPILVNKKLVTNLKDKANIFNDFFIKQCQPIPNNSTLPSIQTFETSNWLAPLILLRRKY